MSPNVQFTSNKDDMPIILLYSILWITLRLFYRKSGSMYTLLRDKQKFEIHEEAKVKNGGGIFGFLNELTN